MELEGKTALVTGGARRVGRALALALARAGCDVVVDYHRSEAEAADVAAEIEALGRRALAVRADVGVRAEVERLVRATEEAFGRLDVLVNSASTFQATPLLEIGEAEWDRVMAVNLKGPFLLAQAAAPLLAAEGDGLIVNISDLAGLTPWKSFPHHSVSKAGLIHLTRVLAKALAPAVRANCIVPGTVLPPEDYTEEQIRRSAGRTALGRIGSPDDVAKALLFLAASDFVTGETIVVDGGRTLM